MAIHCVNFRSHAVIDLASELGASPLIVAGKIALWQEANGLDQFPTALDLNTFASEKKNVEPEKKVSEPIGEEPTDEPNFADLFMSLHPSDKLFISNSTSPLLKYARP